MFWSQSLFHLSEIIPSALGTALHQLLHVSVLKQIQMSQTYTLAWCGSEGEVTRGDAAVGQDGGVDPGKKV